MKRSIEISKVKLAKLIGRDKYDELFGNKVTSVKLKRKQIKRIERSLVLNRVACMIVTKNGVTEMVNSKYVTIAPRYKFEKDHAFAKKQVEKYHENKGKKKRLSHTERSKIARETAIRNWAKKKKMTTEQMEEHNNSIALDNISRNQVAHVEN